MNLLHQNETRTRIFSEIIKLKRYFNAFQTFNQSKKLKKIEEMSLFKWFISSLLYIQKINFKSHILYSCPIWDIFQNDKINTDSLTFWEIPRTHKEKLFERRTFRPIKGQWQSQNWMSSFFLFFEGIILHCDAIDCSNQHPVSFWSLTENIEESIHFVSVPLRSSVSIFITSLIHIKKNFEITVSIKNFSNQ